LIANEHAGDLRKDKMNQLSLGEMRSGSSNLYRQHHQLDVVIVYKNFKFHKGFSHVGLGVNAINTCKVLNRLGIKCRVQAMKEESDLPKFLAEQASKPTHIIIQALWINVGLLGQLCSQYSDTQFAVVSHSNVGFLQVEPGAIKLFKQCLELEGESVNFHASGNSDRFCKWVENAFHQPCTYLPNMYYLHHKNDVPNRAWHDVGGTLRIGIFGATRIQKNFLSAVGAAMEISQDLSAQTEIWINSDRNDGGSSANTIRDAAKALTAGMPRIKLIECGWNNWDTFKKIVASMHLMLQPSYSETFNLVTADGVAHGVASVVSDAIDWAPPSWIAAVDDVSDIARAGVGLLNDPRAAAKGLEALKSHNRQSENDWVQYLLYNRFGNA
jgi:hypothetical protein